MKNTTHHLLSAVAANLRWPALLLLALSAVSIRAAGTDTWVGNTDANWNTAGNWTTSGGSTPPAAGDSLVFGSAGSAGLTLTNNISSLALNAINLNGPDAFTISGNALTLAGGLTNNSSATESISLSLGGAGGVANPQGTVTLGGANTYTGATIVGDGVHAALLNQPSPSVSASTVPTPLLYLSFDSVTGSTVNNTGSLGAAGNGGIQGTATIVGGGRLGGNCLSIPATLNAGYVEVTNSVVLLSASTTWTMAMWIKTTTAGGTYLFQGPNVSTFNSGSTSFHLNNGGNNSAGTGMGINSRGSTAGGVRNSQGWQSGSTTINDGNWHFVVMTSDASNKKISYVDGNVDSWSESTWGGTATGGQVLIGGSGDTADGNAGLNGLIDEVSMYNTTLSQAQVQALMAAGTVSPSSAVTVAAGSTLDLVGRWQTVAGLNGAGTVDSTLASGAPFLIVNNTAASTFGGVISNTAGSLSLTKAGTGTLTLNGTAANTYTGATTVNGGTLIEDFANATSANNLINSGSTLVLGGGTLQVKQQNATTTSQTFASTTVNPGSTAVIATPVGGSGTLTVALGAITQKVGGTVDFTTNTSAGASITTTTPIVNGILGGWATVGDSLGSTTTGDWATTNGSGQVVAYTGYTVVSGSTAPSTTQNWINSGGTAAISASGTINSLVQMNDFNVPSGDTLTLGSGGLFMRGISRWLLNNNAGSTAGSAILKSGLATGELYVHVPENDANANNWTIWPVIADGSVPTTLYKDGPGLVKLGNFNTHTAGTVVNGGTLQLIAGGGTGSIRGTVTINPGATLNLSAVDAVGYNVGVCLSSIIVNGGTLSDTSGGNEGFLMNINLIGGTVTSTLGNYVFSAQTPAVYGINCNPSPITSVFSAPIYFNGLGLINVAQGTTPSGIDLNISGVIKNSTGITRNGAGTILLGNANTFAGGWINNAGTTVIGNNAAFGTGLLTINGGSISNNAGNSYTVTNPVSLATTTSFGVGAGDTLTLSGIITNTGGVTKANGGTLVLSGANSYAGATTVSGGTLLVNNTTGSGTGAGNVTVNSGTTLGGTGIITNGVTLNSGSILSPGSNSVATLTVGSLALNSGVTNNFEFNGTPTNDQVVVSLSNGLTVNGGVFNLYQAGTTLPLLTPGTYNLIKYTDAIGGAGLDSGWTTASATNPHILNNRPGFTYQFGTSGGWVTLAVVSTGNIGAWTNNADGNWSVAGNWSGLAGTMPPNGVNDSATFGASTGFRTVNMDANNTVGVINMTNANSFAITNAANTLTLDDSGGGVLVTVSAGTSNSIQTAVALNDNLTAAVGSGKSLVISGIISNSVSGVKTVTASGAGTLALSGNNTYGPAAGTVGTTLSAGILQVGGNTALGAGDLSVTASSTLQAGGNVTLSNNVVVGSGVTTTVDANSASLTLGGVISGSGAISESTAGTVTLTGANTYNGATTLSAGTLQLQNANALQNSTLTMASGTTLSLEANANNTFAPASFAFSGSGSPTYNFYANNINTGSGNTLVLGNFPNTVPNTTDTISLTGGNNYTLQIGGNAAGTSAVPSYNSTTWNAGSGIALSIPGGITIAYPAAYTMTFGGAGNISLGALTPNGANNIAVTKTDTGTLTLTGANALNAGTLSVSGGTLALTGSAALTSTTSSFLIGTVAGVPGAVYQSGAGSSVTAKPVGGGWNLGNAPGASGYYNLSAGTLTIQNGGELDPAGNTGGAGTFGQFDMSGGTVNVGTSGTGATYFLPCRQSTAGNGESSVVNLSSGTFAIFNGMGDGAYGGYEANWNAGGQTNVTTISGSALFQSLTCSVKFNWANNAGNVGIFNLNGGIWQMLGLNNSQNASVQVNFNGGTVKAGNSANTTFLGNSAAAYVYGGGATVDNNGQTITISQPLLAPAGNGVTTIPVSSGGAGYVMPPQVLIAGGGGSNATAYAQISGGAVTGIVVTSPGQNYSSAPTVTLVGGGYTTAATNGAVTTAPNTSGGLTAIGSSTLTLGGASTYTGATVVSNSSFVVVSGSLAALNKQGNGTLTLNAANPAVTTATIVGAGTLALGAGGTISNTPSITVSNGAVYDVSAVTGGYTLLGSQSLYGSGTNKGSISTLSGAKIYAGSGTGNATNTFNNNLVFAPGAVGYFNLDTVYNGANDFISIGGSLTNNGSVHVSVASPLVGLDTNADYVLMTAAGGVFGTVSPSPIWGVQPTNWFSYVVKTNGANSVVLHYTGATLPIVVSGAASPATLTRNESAFISVTVVPGTGNITNETLDASAVGLPNNLPMALFSSVSGTNIYTNTIVIPSGAAVGPYTFVATMTDDTPLTGSGNVSLLVVATNQVWNGAGFTANTDDNTNWASGAAPGYVGDTMTFAGSVNTGVNVDQNYTVAGLLFSNNAASFTIAGNTLTLSGSGPIANYSTNAQTLNAALADAGGGLTASGVGPIVLGTDETYTGPTTVSSGILKVSGSVGEYSGSGFSGLTTVGNTATNAVLVNSGYFYVTNINVGTVSNAVGAIYNSGAVSATLPAGSTDFQVGNAAGAYGYLNVSGGGVGCYELGIAGETGAGNGLMDVYSGTVNVGGWLVMSRTAFAQTGVLNVFGGTLNYGGAGGTLANCWGSGQTAIINVMGGQIANNANAGFNLNDSGNAANTGILNLDGGTAKGFNVMGSYGQVNFNGGTLQASSANTSFMTGLGSVRIYGGGATINDNGQAITVNQPLLAPAGNGVTTPTIASGGAGYVAPPIVTVVTNVSDTTGSGATAIAQIDTSTGNATSGQVTNVIITCPGVNYTAVPTFALSGGGASTPAVVTGNANTANAGGSLTKTGSGTLSLVGSSTYTGNTTISGGTLKLLSDAILHMSFDSASGTTAGATVTNQGTGGSAMNGTIVGTATIVSGGRFGNALNIPSGGLTANYVIVSNGVVPFNNSGAWSVGVWVKTSTAGGCYLYQGDGNWASGDTSFYLNNGSTTGTKAGGVRYAQGWETGTATVNDGNWHFVVLTCNNGTKTQYVDGALDALTVNQWNGNGTATQMRIGGTADGGDGNAALNGLIDEVYVYNRALSQAEIQSLYNYNSQPVLPTNTLVNVTSGTLDVGGLSQQIGGLTGSASVLLDDSGAAGSLIVGNASSTTFSGVISDTSGAGSLVKIGSGMLTLSGANTYGGSTTVSNGTLAVNGSIGVGAVNVASGGILGGSGLINGAVTVAGNLSPSGEGAFSSPGTLNVYNNLTLAAGGICSFALSDTSGGANDQIVLTGALTNNNTVFVDAFHISAPSASDYLDSNTDYVLISTYGGIAGNYDPAPIWDVAPANAANFTIVTNATQVLLHYTATAPPTAGITASPATVTRNQSTLVTVTVTNGSAGISNVVLNASSIGGAANVALVSNGGNVYTNIIAASAGTTPGLYTLGATVTDSNGFTANVAVSLTVTIANDVWDGLGAGNNFAVNLNWTNDAAPGYVGDSLEFAGSMQTSPNMEANYSVTGVTFDSTASNFNIGTLNSSSLTLTANGVVNNSANAQTLNVPVTLGAAQTLNAAAGPLTLGQSLANGGYLVTVSGVSNSAINGIISGAGGLTKTGNGMLGLAGNNTFNGATTISGGTLVLTGNGAISSTTSPFEIGTVAGTSAAVYQAGANTFATAQPTGGAWNLGNAPGASGYYNLSAGTLTIGNGGELDPAGSTGGAGTFGEFDMSGGTVNVGTSGTGATYFLPCRAGASGESSVVNLSGGTFTIFNGMGDATYGGYEANWNGGGQTNVTTISGSALFQSLSESVKLNWANNATNVGVLNLNGGTFQMLGLNNSQNSNVLVNLNGGTVKAGNSANGTFLGNSASAYVYAGGGTVDNNAKNITITQPIVAPAGNGITVIPVSGGAGYVMPPLVLITDTTGSNATAYAQIGGGAVTNIVVTCPGNNYSSTPTVTLVGGGYASAATIGTVTTAANTGGGLTFNGTAETTLTGSNTYAGGTTVNGGILEISTDAQLGAVPGSSVTNITLNGGELYNNNSTPVLSANRTILLGAGGGYLQAGWGAQLQSVVVNGLITGSGGLNINWDSAPIYLNAVNNYQGNTTIGTAFGTYWNSTSANPTLALGIDNALPYGAGAGIVVFGTSSQNNTATLNLNGHNATINGLSGNANAIIDNTNALASTNVLTVGRSSGIDTFAGVIQNTGGMLALTKTGASTLNLTGTNTYTGNTTVNGGTLAIANATLATNSTVTVADSGVLNLAFSVTNTVASLVLNGVSQPAGVYNNSTSPSYITGTGSLLVLTSGGSASTNAYLTSLVLTPAGALSPAFTTNGFTYNATNSYGVMPTVTVTNADPTATNTLIYNGTPVGLLASGTASSPLSLTLGVTNVVQVLVTAQDGVTTNLYTVNVTELPSQTVPHLTNSVSGTTLTLSWPADHLGYRLLTQTNNLNKGVSSNTNDWGTLPGSTAITTTNITIIKATNNAYYRLVYP